MDWSGVFERHGWKAEQVGHEPFHPLGVQAQQARAQGGAVAKVSTTVSMGSYGNKVSFTVSLECIQNEATINLTGEAAFRKAAALVNDGITAITSGAIPMNSL